MIKFIDTRLIISCFTFIIYTIIYYSRQCAGHGRLIEPPSRASAWRYGFPTPPDYNDNQLYCGGFTRQWKQNDGKCGVCGDAWDLPEPRDHEYGGKWGQGVIVRKYVPGSDITLRIELTASHMGYFEFRLCPAPNAQQDCLDRYLLTILGGSPSQPMPDDLNTRFYPRDGSRIYEMKAQLPELQCAQCLLQWRYVAGNNWGICPNGTGAVGCGPQEEFRACADITLGKGVYTPIYPMRPTLRTTIRPIINRTTSTESSNENKLYEPSSSFSVVIFAIILFILLCALAVWYMHRYNNRIFKNWRDIIANSFCKLQRKTILKSNAMRTNLTITPTFNKKITNDCSSAFTTAAPIPPPRSKRQSKVKELSADESSIA